MNINQKMTPQERNLLIILTSLLLALLIVTVVKCVALNREREPLSTSDFVIFDEEYTWADRGQSTLEPTTRYVPAVTTEITITQPTTVTTVTTTTTTKKQTTKAPAAVVETTTTTASQNIGAKGAVYVITPEERHMLARLLYLEGGSTSRKCQKMIMEVVFNHYENRGRKTSLTDIVYSKNLFSPASRINSTKAQQTQYDIVDEICRDGVTILPSNVLYFRASYYHSWAKPYTNIDNVYFSY